MRHEELKNPQAFERVDAPAMAAGEAAPAQPEHAVPDMPKAAAVFMVLAYAALLAAFLVTVGGARVDFVVVIGAFYLAMFFALPAVMLGVENDVARRPGLFEFLDRGIDTETGRISGGGALVQMLMVPVLLAFAILAMGIIYLLV